MHDATKGKAWDKSEHLYFNVPNVKPLPMQWFLFCELTFSRGRLQTGRKPASGLVGASFRRSKTARISD